MNIMFMGIGRCSLELFGVNRMESMGRKFRTTHSPLDDNFLIYFLVFICICVGIGYAMHWLLHRSRSVTNLRLFYSLCRTNELNWKESLLLWKVAAKSTLRLPPAIFIRPDLLESAISKSRNEADRRTITGIHKMLFDHIISTERSAEKRTIGRKPNSETKLPQTESIRHNSPQFAKNETADVETESPRCKTDRTPTTVSQVLENDFASGNSLRETKHHKNPAENNLTLNEIAPSSVTATEFSLHDSEQNSILQVVTLPNNNLPKNRLPADSANKTAETPKTQE